jgi:hypothetical protein
MVSSPKSWRDKSSELVQQITPPQRAGGVEGVASPGTPAADPLPLATPLV